MSSSLIICPSVFFWRGGGVVNECPSLCLAEDGNHICAAHYYFSSVAAQEVLCIQHPNTLLRDITVLTRLSYDINFLFSQLFHQINTIFGEYSGKNSTFTCVPLLNYVPINTEIANPSLGH